MYLSRTYKLRFTPKRFWFIGAAMYYRMQRIDLTEEMLAGN
ncbi:MAG TPA: hypothetical protein O0X70_02955 [Methanocorpusculum sp.]|nr:hypothetical protein [Methanocorpusculum sp.]